MIVFAVMKCAYGTYSFYPEKKLYREEAKAKAYIKEKKAEHDYRCFDEFYITKLELEET